MAEERIASMLRLPAATQPQQRLARQLWYSAFSLLQLSCPQNGDDDSSGAHGAEDSRR